MNRHLKKTLVELGALTALLIIIIVGLHVLRVGGIKSAAAHSVDGCTQWARRNGDHDLVMKCEQNAPIEQILNHVAQQRCELKASR